MAPKLFIYLFYFYLVSMENIKADICFLLAALSLYSPAFYFHQSLAGDSDVLCLLDGKGFPPTVFAHWSTPAVEIYAHIAPPSSRLGLETFKDPHSTLPVPLGPRHHHLVVVSLTVRSLRSVLCSFSAKRMLESDSFACDPSGILLAADLVGVAHLSLSLHNCILSRPPVSLIFAVALEAKAHEVTKLPLLPLPPQTSISFVSSPPLFRDATSFHQLTAPSFCAAARTILSVAPWNLRVRVRRLLGTTHTR